MRGIFLSLLMMLPLVAKARSIDFLNEGLPAVEVSQLFDAVQNIPIVSDLVDKEDKVNSCIVEYVSKRDKSYDKITQSTLYDLIHNFGYIASKIYGNKPKADNIPFEEKIQALARVQCEAYYALSVLK